MLPPFVLSPADATARAVTTRHWLSSLAVPAVVRAALNSVIDAVAVANKPVVSSALAELARVASSQLDAASTAEINILASELSERNGKE